MTAIVRINLDVSEKEAKDSIRLKQAAESIGEIQKKYSKIVLLSHRGRPKGRDEKLSLKPIGVVLSKIAKKKIKFVDNDNLEKAREIIGKGGNGIYLLENMRFLEGEDKNDPALSRTLAGFGNIFINDDFATAHRSSASVTGITAFLKSIPGPIVKAEVTALKKAIKNPKHPFVLIIGGAKIADKMGVIENLIHKSDIILLGGGAGNTAMKASGTDIGKSIFDKSLLEKTQKLIQDKKVIYPVDFRVNGKSILDIGPNTERLYVESIRKAKTIIWAGPLGNFENKRFAKGSETIAKAIAASRAFTVAGGGETTALIMSLKLGKKISFLSTGGSAMLEFLAGKKLPALEALKLKY